MPVRICEGIPNIEFLMLNRGVIDQVCNVGRYRWRRSSERRGNGTAPKNPPCVSLSRTPPSTMRSTPFHERLGEAGSGAGALLVAIIERRVGAPAVRDEFVDADRGIDDAAAGEAELLVVAGHRQERLEVGRGVIEIADAVALVERVVVAIAVGLDGVAVE